MGVKERRERAKENLRQEILNAAGEMFAAEGYANVSMRKIAGKIEYSPTTIYLYFKDKDDLLRQICEDTFAHLGDKLTAIGKKHGDTFESLRRGLKAYIEFGLQHPKQYEVTFMLPLDNHIADDGFSFEGSMGQRAFDFLRQKVTICMQRGELRQDDIEVVSQSLWAGCHGVTSLLIAHHSFPFVARNRLIDKTIELLLDGLKP